MTSFPAQTVCLCTVCQIRAIRFVKLSEADIKSFSEERENVYTQKKALYDSKLFKEFLTSKDERRELQEIPATELQKFAIKFVLGLREENGT